LDEIDDLRASNDKRIEDLNTQKDLAMAEKES